VLGSALGASVAAGEATVGPGVPGTTLVVADGAPVGPDVCTVGGGGDELQVATKPLSNKSASAPGAPIDFREITRAV
jgi:hypothetical protein